MKRIPRALRSLCLVVGGWLALFLAVNLVILLSGVTARWAGKDPRLHDDRWPDITNLRAVGDRLLISGETSLEQYRELADRDVTLVIDMRTGGSADLSSDDPQHLARLGLEYAELPIPDGGAPASAKIRCDLLTWWRPRTAGSLLTAGAEWVVPPLLLRPTRQPGVGIPRCWSSSPLDRQPSSRSGS
jgi:hypothetical protein